MLFKIKIKHLTVDESGKSKYAADTFLVEAESVIDAEAKLVASRTFEDYNAESITKPNIHQVIDAEAERYYRCKIVTTAADSRTVSYILVNADDFDTAVNMAKVYGGSSEYDIEFVQLTPIKGHIA